jgi:hypothetical protein
MHRIDKSDRAVALEATETPQASGGYFTRGNPGSGIPSTTVSSDWANAVQEEICNAIEKVGITLAKGTRDQLYRAALQSVAVREINDADDSAEDDDCVVEMDPSSTDRTYTLPTLASRVNRKLTVYHVGASNTVIVERAGSDTIQGSMTSVTLNPGESVTLYSSPSGTWRQL